MHNPTTAKRKKVLSPEKEARLNHFRRHFKGLGAEAESPSWADSGIGPNPVEDGSFAAAWAGLDPGACGPG